MTSLDDYARIPIAFEVARVLDIAVRDGGFGGFEFSERELETPYVKDYDAIEGPEGWARRFDLSNWGLLAARVDGRHVGGATLAYDTRGILILEGRLDLAVLWDIRVLPEARGRGVGTSLFRAALEWARARRCRWLKIETQNVNVPACRFYARQGCQLGSIHRFAYADFPQEVQLLWYKELSRSRLAG